jgi:hypothetical protein
VAVAVPGAYVRAVMRPYACLLAVVAVSLVVTIGPARAAYHPLEEIPVESRVIREIEDLAATYGLGAAFHTTRPWDRADLGAFLDEILRFAPEANGDPALARLRRELRPGADGWAPLLHARDEQTSVEVSPYLNADYAEDRARRSILRDLRGGIQASAMLGRGVLLFTDVYAGTTSPGPHGNPVDSRHFGLIEGVQVNPYFDRAYLRARGPLGTVTLGHSWLCWGPGVTGGVGLSDGAPAYDFVEFRTRFLRRLQLEWFVASLDPVVGTYLAGHRIEVRPGASLDLAFAELARFDGVANAPLYLVPVVPYSLIERRVIKSSDLPADTLEGTIKNNVMWVADVTWRARPGTRLYGEIAVDDISFSSEKRPLSIAWQTGVHSRWRRGEGALSARGEYSRVYRYTYSSYHHHDFAFGGLPTGYPLGPDAEQLFGQLAWAPGTDWTFTLEGTQVRKGEAELGDAYVLDSPRPPLALSGVVEQDTRVAASVDWSPTAGLTLGLTAGDARLRAPDHVVGRNASGFFGGVRGRLRW